MRGSQSWWLSGDLTDIYAAQDDGVVPPGGQRRFYVRVRGERSPSGRYGHLGSYPYELVVEEVLEVRPSSSGACP